MSKPCRRLQGTLRAQPGWADGTPCATATVFMTRTLISTISTGDTRDATSHEHMGLPLQGSLTLHSSVLPTPLTPQIRPRSAGPCSSIPFHFNLLLLLPIHKLSLGVSTRGANSRWPCKPSCIQVPKA